MSSLGENIQFYRKREELTQEQLAEQLEVSRQTVSKWEAGASYPEMEKILQLCDLFSCNMDILMRKDASQSEVEDSQSYDTHMEGRRKRIALGVVLLISGIAMYELLSGFGVTEMILDTLFMSVVIIGILVLAVAGMQHENYRKKHPTIPEFYSQEEKDLFDEKFPIRIATGIGMILIGLLISMNGENFPLAAGMTEDFYYGIFLLLVAGAVGIIIHTGIGKEKYDIEAYNKKKSNKDKEVDHRIGVWCSCIMLVATILFLTAGLCFQLWSICWIVYPVGGLLCGIIAIILGGKKEN